jgi:hypothetical protein
MEVNNMKQFKVSIRTNEEVSAEKMDEAFTTACKIILREIGVANVNDEVVEAMKDRFTYTVAGMKE